MRRYLFFIIIGLVAAFNLVSCSAEDGEDGKDGNANVQSFQFDVSTLQWQDIDESNDGIEYDQNSDLITSAIMNDGAVLVYV